MATLWERLQKPIRGRLAASANSDAKKIARKRWIHAYEIEDFLSDFDDRLYGLDFIKFSKSCGLGAEVIWSVPSRKSNSFSGSDMFGTADFCAVLILLERIGFDVDPTKVVEEILHDIQNLTEMTGSELSAWTWPKQRHKMCPVMLVLDDSDYRRHGAVRSLTTSRGYKILASIGADGRVGLLECQAPKYRRRRDQVSVRCVACGLGYLKGDADDVANHRSVHRKRMKILDPAPDERFFRVLNGASLYQVDALSPAWAPKAILERARFFRRELHFDFLQWDSGEENSERCLGFLLPFGSRIAGACCFRRRQATDPWYLDWIWVAPKLRRQGVVASVWKELVLRFGDFDLGYPLSDGMISFLEKIGHQQRTHRT